MARTPPRWTLVDQRPTSFCPFASVSMQCKRRATPRRRSIPSTANSTQVFAPLLSCAKAAGIVDSHTPIAETPAAQDNPTSIRMFVEFLALGKENVGERQRSWPNRTFQLIAKMLTSVLRQFCHVDDKAFAFHRISFTPADYPDGHSLGLKL